MRSRTTLALTALSSALVTALSAGTASAAERDGARFRYGAAMEVGGLFAPGVVDLGFIGVQGQLGVQLSHLVGIYAAPNIDLVRGSRQRGVQIGGALLIDFTLAHVLTIGVGPDLAGFTALGGGAMSGGVLYGARLHLAINPLVGIARDGIRRRALTIGLDLRLATGGAAAVLSTGEPAGGGVLASRRAAAGELMAAPTLTIGYQAF